MFVRFSDHQTIPQFHSLTAHTHTHTHTQFSSMGVERFKGLKSEKFEWVWGSNGSGPYGERSSVIAVAP